jgi:hypothetical protein
LPDWEQKAEYIRNLKKEFAKVMRVTDSTLMSVAANCNGNLKSVPPKAKERILEKARIAYKGNLARVTDFERRSIICQEFPDLISALHGIDSEFVVIRVRNRFAKENTGAKDTAGYRDCQLLCMVNGSDLIFEVQLHLQCIFEIKEKVANSEDAGLTGHERYIQWRGLMEPVKAELQAELQRRLSRG